jgi:hypothetical protein
MARRFEARWRRPWVAAPARATASRRAKALAPPTEARIRQWLPCSSPRRLREAVGERRQQDRGGASRTLWIPPDMKEWRADGKIP